MKLIGLAIVGFLAFAAGEAAAAPCGLMDCHYNKTCQQLRAAGQCEKAMAAGGTHVTASERNSYGNVRRGCTGILRARGAC